jgi:hypothetical protein
VLNRKSKILASKKSEKINKSFRKSGMYQESISDKVKRSDFLFVDKRSGDMDLDSIRGDSIREYDSIRRVKTADTYDRFLLCCNTYYFFYCSLNTYMYVHVCVYSFRICIHIYVHIIHRSSRLLPVKFPFTKIEMISLNTEKKVQPKKFLPKAKSFGSDKKNLSENLFGKFESDEVINMNGLGSDRSLMSEGDGKFYIHLYVHINTYLHVYAYTCNVSKHIHIHINIYIYIYIYIYRRCR